MQLSKDTRQLLEEAVRWAQLAQVGCTRELAVEAAVEARQRLLAVLSAGDCDLLLLPEAEARWSQARLDEFSQHMQAFTRRWS